MKKNDEQVFNHYCRLLYKISVIMLCNEQDALDAVQETFLRYLLRNKEFENEDHEKFWLTKVNINICKNMLRFKKMHPSVQYESIAAHIHSSEETGLMDSLMTLKTRDKEILLLYYIEGYSCKEIAGMKHMTEGTVRKQLERARKRLKNKYVGEERQNEH